MAQSVLDPVRGKPGRTQPATVVPLVAPHRRRPAWMIWGAALVMRRLSALGRSRRHPRGSR